MYKLYHYSLCPFSRMIRFILNEIAVDYILVEQKFWEFDEQFLQINPAGTVPVLISKNGDVFNHSHLIIEYLIETYKPTFLFPEENSKLETKKVSSLLFSSGKRNVGLYVSIKYSMIKCEWLNI